MSSQIDSGESLLVAVPDWWVEGDRALGVALVAAKATEIHMANVHKRNLADGVVARMYERAKARSCALERAIGEWKIVAEKRQEGI